MAKREVIKDTTELMEQATADVVITPVKKTKKKAKNSECCDSKKTNIEILEDFLACNTVCANLGTFKKKDLKGIEFVDYIVENIPAVVYVMDQIVNYIFSNGLTTGNIEKEDALKEFLYRKNESDVTNYDELRTAISEAILYGECGLRWYEDNLYHIKKGKYAPFIYEQDGIKKIVAWVTSRDDSNVAPFKLKKTDTEVLTKEDILRQMSESKLILMDKSEFVNIKNKHDKIHSDSPFEKDKLRLSLMANAYERLNYDVIYDGPGRIILRPKSGYVESENNEVSTATVMNVSTAAQKERADKAKREVERVGRQIKNSSSDSVILLSNAFDDKIEHLERVTKATEFLDWLDKDVETVCQILGIDPSLVGAGKIAGNVSMEKIIDNGMLNSIIPLREKFAIQFSEMISTHLGFEKVFFDKYEMQQTETTTDKVESYTNMMYKILVGIKDTDGGAEKETLLETVKIMNEVIRNALVNTDGTVKSIEEV